MFDAVKATEILNLARSMELAAISQYMQLHYFLHDRNFDKLSKSMKKVAIEEMHHAEALAERVKQLNGEPCTYADGAARIPENIYDCYEYAKELETTTRNKYQEYIEQLAAVDEVSKQLLSRIAVSEANHLDYFEGIWAALSLSFEGVQQNSEYKD